MDHARSETEGEVHILLVEDGLTDATLFRATLENHQESGSGHTIVHAQTLAAGLDLLEHHQFDIAFLDLSLPDASRLDVVRALQAAVPELPLVVLTGHDDDRLAREAVRIGAQDYLVKGRLDASLLVRSISYAIERKRLHLQQLSTKDEFISRVSHELRTPLTVIYAAHEMLVDGHAGPLNQLQGGLLSTARRNSTQLMNMVTELIDAAQVDAEPLQMPVGRVALAPLVRDVITELSLIARTKGLELTADISESLPQILGDVERVRQILVNLVSNSVEHTPGNGSITIGADKVDNTSVEVTVSDTGCGIAPDHATHVFERHYQVPTANRDRSSQSLGLGLTICRDIVRDLGGRIWLESEFGQGTTVHFTLPKEAKTTP